MSIDFVILAAGAGSRMQSTTPKIFHKIAGKPIIRFVIDTCKDAQNAKTIIVTNKIFENHELFDDVKVCIQKKRLGTADAVISALPFISSEYAVIVCGDMPFLSKKHIEMLQNDRSDIAFLAMNIPENLANMPYGRVILDQKSSNFQEIVEYLDATEVQKKCPLANSGIYKIKTELLKKYLLQITPNKKKQELYLPDVLNIANENGESISVLQSNEYWPFHGINTMQDLSQAEDMFQNQLRQKFMNNGVRFLAPTTVFLSFDTEIASNVLIEQNVVIKTKVKISEHSIIKSFSYIENCTIENGVHVGPFARIRGGSVLLSESDVGNFVELKNSTVGSKTKIKHLSYIGDTTIGTSSNIGAGTITCNYDGVNKHKTTIGDNVLIGSNCSIIAPLTIDSGAIVGASSVVSQSIPKNSLALSRPALNIKIDGALKFFANKLVKKT